MKNAVLTLITCSVLFTGCYDNAKELQVKLQQEETKRVELRLQSEREQREFEERKYPALVELCREQLKLSQAPGRNSSCNIK